jgi:hypothetical protein
MVQVVSFPRKKRGRSVKLALASDMYRGQENADLYIHSPISLDEKQQKQTNSVA